MLNNLLKKAIPIQAVKKANHRSDSNVDSASNNNNNNPSSGNEGESEAQEQVKKTDLLPYDSQIGLYTVVGYYSKSLVVLSKQDNTVLGKICKYVNGVQRELEFIRALPLKTILRPYWWIPCDKDHYIMLYSRSHYTPIQSYFACILRQIVLTFDYLHDQGLVHGNVKYKNAFVVQDEFYLADFDKAGKLEEVQDREFVGTHGHVAPELYSGEPYSFAAEMYAVGVLLVELPLDEVFTNFMAHFKWSKASHTEVRERLLSIFKSSTDRPLKTLWGWGSHCISMKVTPDEFETFKRLVHALLSADPTERPTAHQVLHGEEYRGLWGKEKASLESIMLAQPKIIGPTLAPNEKDTDVLMIDEPKATIPAPHIKIQSPKRNRAPAKTTPAPKKTRSGSPASKVDEKQVVRREPLADVSNKSFIKSTRDSTSTFGRPSPFCSASNGLSRLNYNELFQMEDLPTELKVLISQYLDTNSKFHIRATNTFWRYLCKLDYFKVNGASAENLSRIIDAYSKIQQPFSLSFKNFKDIKVSDFVDGVTKLTNLTSLELERILDRSYLYCNDNVNPWMKLQVMTQLIRFNPWCRTKYPLQLILHLTNLTEFQYNEASWDRDGDRFRSRHWVYRVIPSLSQLESLEMHVQYIDRNPFGLVANPSRLTRLLLAGGTYNTIIKSDSLKGFVNLKRLKLDMSLPVEIEHFTALEDLKLSRGSINSFEHNQMLTRLVMKCQTIDDNCNQALRHLTNMKKLDIHELSAYQDNQIRQDSDFEFLSQMPKLEMFKLNTHQAVSSKIFSYVNSVNLKTIQWSFAKDIDINPLAKISNLRVLVLTQHDKEVVVNYDPISTLTNLTCLKIDGISSAHKSTFINTLTMLKVLAIESANGFGGDLDLSTHLNLESLDILGTTSADVLPTIASPKITRLCCPLQPSTNYDLLLTHPIRHLRVTNDNEEFFLWKTMEQMTSLQKLVLVKIHDFPKLLQLIKLPDLQVLEFTNLKKFPLSYSTRLTSLREVICNGKTVYTRRDE